MPKQEEEGTSATKAGHRLQPQHENFDELCVGADERAQLNEELIDECCSIKHKFRAILMELHQKR